MYKTGKLFIFFILILSGCFLVEDDEDDIIENYSPGYQLIWADNFDGPSLNPAVWTAENGTGSQYGLWDWGNNEKQFYKAENAVVKDGILTIRVLKEQNYQGKAYNYTSARIQTQGKFSIDGGKIEARIKLPRGRGFWPAFWLLGEAGNWPFCGEIDILEMQGGISDNAIGGTVHFGTSWEWEMRYYLSKVKTHSSALANDWHVYGFEWTPDSLRWYFDGEIFHEVNFNNLPVRDSGGKVINMNIANLDNIKMGKKFYLLLNVAVGGDYIQQQLPDDSVFVNPNNPDSCMQVDWIKVWK